MTPSCSSAVTLDRRCSGTLNSVSSFRRLISMSWLRVSTNSETMVIRVSSVSTLTRIDWFLTALSSPSALSAVSAGFAGLAAFATGFGSGFGAGAARPRSRGRRARARRARLRPGAADAPRLIDERAPGHRGVDRGLAEGAFELVERDLARAQRPFERLVDERARGHGRRGGGRPAGLSRRRATSPPAPR